MHTTITITVEQPGLEDQVETHTIEGGYQDALAAAREQAKHVHKEESGVWTYVEVKDGAMLVTNDEIYGDVCVRYKVG